MSGLKKMYSSVRAKLLGIIIALVAIPVLVICIISYTSSSDNALEDNEVQLKWKAEYLKAEVSDIVDANIAALKTLAASPATREYLLGNPSVSTEEAFEACKNIDSIFNDGNATIITNAEGMQVIRTVGDCVNISSRDYFEASMNGQTYISNAIISYSTGVRQMTMSVPVYNGNQVIGIVQRNYDLDDFRPVLMETIDESEEAILVAWDGIIATHSEHKIAAGDEEEDRSNSTFFKSGLDSGFYEGSIGRSVLSLNVEEFHRPISIPVLFFHNRKDDLQLSLTFAFLDKAFRNLTQNFELCKPSHYSETVRSYLLSRLNSHDRGFSPLYLLRDARVVSTFGI